jgi:RHS repeat-associated protein
VRLLLRLSCLVCALFFTVAAGATCTQPPTGSLSVSGPDTNGNAVATIPYTIYGDPTYAVEIALYVQIGNDPAFIGHVYVYPGSGTVTIPFSTVCWAVGGHQATAVINSGVFTDCLPYHADSVVSVPAPKPSVSLSVTPPDANGNVTARIESYNFPYSTQNDRLGYIFLDDTRLWPAEGSSWSPSAMSGGPVTSPTPPTVNVACLGSNHRFRARVVTCLGFGNPDYETWDEKPVGTVGEDKVGIDKLERTGVNGDGRAKLRASIHYDVPNLANGRYVELWIASWEDTGGVLHDGYLIGSVTSPTPGGSWVKDFDAPSGARTVKIVATQGSCAGLARDWAAIDCPTCGEAPGGTSDPVLFADGNMSYSDGEPLPPLLDGLTLSRTYDSQQRNSRLFGQGWTTLLDQRLTIDVIRNIQVVSLGTPDNHAVLFEGSGSSYTQRWPKNERARGTLRYDSTAAVYSYRPSGSLTVSRFRGSDGRFIGYTNVQTGRSLDVNWSAGLPLTATDSWTGVTWQFHTDSTTRRMTSIDVAGSPTIAWSYGYDGSGQLTAVTAPGGAAWRTYEYGTWGMTAAKDSLGNLIESHDYDANGAATSSTGPRDEITSLQYGLAAPNSNDTLTRVTTRAGATIDYVMRGVAGAYRTVHVVGGCTSCGARDTIYAYDPDGHVVRRQAANGFITISTYTDNRLTAVQELYEPAGCSPLAASDHCRSNEDTLPTAALEASTAATTTTYAYADANWPDRVTSTATDSVLAPGAQVVETVTYDATTGEALTRSLTGSTGSAVHAETRITTTSLYNGTEGAAFGPGGAFQTAWLTLAQPAGLRKQLDGPRTDVSDLTQWVYYPNDSSVTANWRGKLAAVRNAAGHITRFENYDVFGNASRVVDPNGVATERTFDSLGRPVVMTVKGVADCDTTADPICATDLATTQTYASTSGPLSTIQRPGAGGVTQYEYDTRSRVIRVSRGPSASDLREQLETTWDVNTGKKSQERTLQKVGGVWTEKKRENFTYDTLAQLSSMIHADTTTVGYGYAETGLLASVRDETHSAPNTAYTYDPSDRMASVKQTLAATFATTTYAYDRRGNLTSVTDPNGNTTSYTYDDFGQMLRQVSLVTGTTTYTYDTTGNLLTSTDANGATTTRTYDALGRVITSSSARTGLATETITSTYDTGTFGLGRLTRTDDGQTATDYAYERRGLLLSESRVLDGISGITRYTYDANGNRNGLTYPSQNTSVYAFDFADRPSALWIDGGAVITSASYLPFGPLTQFVFASGMTKTATFDNRYRMTENKLTGSTGTIADYTYTYDAAGNIMSLHDALDPTYNRDFGYDDLNRLTTANTGPSLWGAGSYTYDAMGNMLAQNLAGTVEVDPNQPLSRKRDLPLRSDALPAPGSLHETYAYAGTTPKLATVTWDGLDHPLAYDGAGNETHLFVDRTYSSRNLLSNVTDASGEGTAHQISYGYDARGVRVKRVESPVPSGSATRYFYYTPELRLLGATTDNSANPWLKRTRGTESIATLMYGIAWFGELPAVQFTGSYVHYTFTDHLGTPLLQTDLTGTVIWRAEYEPYGNLYALRTGTSRLDQPLRFPGQEVAMTWEGREENYNIFRWYRAGWGRYTQADPIGLEGDLNHYRYVVDNPLGGTDMFGLKCCIKSLRGVLTQERAYQSPNLYRNKIRATICADVENPGDCEVTQRVLYVQRFDGRAWTTTFSSPFQDTLGTWQIQRGAKQICFTDTPGDDYVPKSGFPWGYSARLETTIGDRSDQQDRKTIRWNVRVICQNPQDCLFIGRWP